MHHRALFSLYEQVAGFECSGTQGIAQTTLAFLSGPERESDSAEGVGCLLGSIYQICYRCC